MADVDIREDCFANTCAAQVYQVSRLYPHSVFSVYPHALHNRTLLLSG